MRVYQCVTRKKDGDRGDQTIEDHENDFSNDAYVVHGGGVQLRPQSFTLFFFISNTLATH
jgi:hypothetical protein